MWIGSELSGLELLTIHSFIRFGYDFWLWKYDDIQTDLPEGLTIKNAAEIIPKEQIFSYKNSNQWGHGKGSLAGFSDLFRYKLLYEYGGWWTDMDITCLGRLPEFSEKGYVFRKHPKLPLVGNIMHVPPKCDLMINCYKKGIETVDENNTDWFKPIQILIDEVKQQNLQKYTIDKLAPPDWWDTIVPLIYSARNTPNTPLIHWMNEEWRTRGINKNIVVKNSFLGNLFEKYDIEVQWMHHLEWKQLYNRPSQPIHTAWYNKLPIPRIFKKVFRKIKKTIS